VLAAATTIRLRGAVSIPKLGPGDDIPSQASQCLGIYFCSESGCVGSNVDKVSLAVGSSELMPKQTTLSQVIAGEAGAVISSPGLYTGWRPGVEPASPCPRQRYQQPPAAVVGPGYSRMGGGITQSPVQVLCSRLLEQAYGRSRGGDSASRPRKKAR
jgi:hypothetical protein